MKHTLLITIPVTVDIPDGITDETLNEALRRSVEWSDGRHPFSAELLEMGLIPLIRGALGDAVRYKHHHLYEERYQAVRTKYAKALAWLDFGRGRKPKGRKEAETLIEALRKAERTDIETDEALLGDVRFDLEDIKGKITPYIDPWENR